MTMEVLVNCVQTGKTIWHHGVRGPNGTAFDLALFKGQTVYPDGETGTYAGVEVIDPAEGKDSPPERQCHMAWREAQIRTNWPRGT